MWCRLTPIYLPLWNRYSELLRRRSLVRTRTKRISKYTPSILPRAFGCSEERRVFGRGATNIGYSIASVRKELKRETVKEVQGDVEKVQLVVKELDIQTLSKNLCVLNKAGVRKVKKGDR